MRTYPDIGEDDNARDYYTLWYTTVVDKPELLASADSVNFEEFDVTHVVESDLDTNVKTYKHWKRGHLTLHGVNYQPVVYFEGKLLQPYSTSPNDGGGKRAQDVGGMFTRRHYDLGVWDAEGKTSSPSSSSLEILVLPPPYVGKHILLNSTEVNSAYGLEKNSNQGGDHNLAKSGAIMQFTAGWDWIQSTPDRNVGIWDKVEFEWIAADIRLHDLHVRVVNITAEEGIEHAGHGADESALPLGDDVTVSAWVDLSLTATYHQSEHDGRPIKGRFDYRVTPSTSESMSSSIILASGTINNITIQQSVAEIHLGKVLLQKVKLWWPHTHSTRQRQPLYSVHVKFRSDQGHDKITSTHESQAQDTFGIRTVSSFTHPKTKSFALRVNGHPTFLTGGNWITTDQFLRYSNSPNRYMQELSMLRHVGLNSIRVWGGGVAETHHFYDAADELGLLIYQEFWMTGDNNGRFAGSYDWPIDHDTYLANARDTILRLRNHPSLILYAGGNELFPIPSSSSDDGSEEISTSPPKDVGERLRKYIADLDNRPYITSSVTEVGNAFDPERTLGPKDGPYGILPEEVFFDRNPGLSSPLLTDDEIKRNVNPTDIEDKDSPGRHIGFQTEVGSVSHPELESLQRFFSEDALDAFPNCGEKSMFGGSVHEEWTYFKYLSFAESNGSLDHICQFAFPPLEFNLSNTSNHRMDSIEDYTWAAQFAQYLQYKSLFEGYTYKMWEWYSAVFVWKASSPAPSFRGALYDSYLATNGGYWGARAGLAGGSPVRLVFNLRDWTLHVINAVPIAVSAASIRWSAYSLDGVLLANEEIPIPGEQVDGDTIVHLESSLPWVGERKSFMTNPHGVQDIILYRFELSYVQLDGLDASRTAKNSYYLTNPSIRNTQSRFSLLGAMRKEITRVNLDARCTMSSGIECTIHNAHSNNVTAVMIKLSLVRNYQSNLDKQRDSRILPSLFSDNYLALVPGEKSHVHITLEDIRHITMLKCSSDGLLKPLGKENIDLMISIDGWNVQESKLPISCDTSSVSL